MLQQHDPNSRPDKDSTTIFAPATAQGRAGVAVVRLSGPASGAVLSSLTGRLPPPRQARLAALRDPATGDEIDRALVLWFPAPASFTGEDVAELHIHGSRAVLARLMAVLAAQPNCRLAEPGEFTHRAFDHGKLDLTEVEGLADLIHAETEAQRRQALRQMEGSLGRLYQDWRQRLLRMLALVEASIDFVDEDLPDDLGASALADLAPLRQDIRRHLADDQRGERLRDGFTIAIVGAPNAGKSSLLNALAGREAAIVSDRAGTTRDVIELALDLGGYPVLLADTAGLRDAQDEVEQEGIRRSRIQIDRADLCLCLVEAPHWPTIPADLAPALERPHLLVVTKTDLRPIDDDGVLSLSLRQGDGLDQLIESITSRVAASMPSGDAPAITRARHREALIDSLAALDRAADAPATELAAEDLRLALRALGRIVGKVDVEDLLDLVFSEFCIGK